MLFLINDYSLYCLYIVMETNVKTRGEGENVRILSTGNQGRTFNKLLGGGRSGRYTIAQKYANAWVVSARVVLIFDILPTYSALVGSHLLTGLNNSDPLLTMLGLIAENRDRLSTHFQENSDRLFVIFEQ
jgi:hypothetical protein